MLASSLELKQKEKKKSMEKGTSQDLKKGRVDSQRRAQLSEG